LMLARSVVLSTIYLVDAQICLEMRGGPDGVYRAVREVH
jgi:hypothetical protein